MKLKRKRIMEYFTHNWVNWQQVSSTAGYEKSILERQSFSEVKITSCSPICEKWLELFGPSGGAASKTGHGTQCVGSGTLPEVPVCESVPSTKAG